MSSVATTTTTTTTSVGGFMIDHGILKPVLKEGEKIVDYECRFRNKHCVGIGGYIMTYIDEWSIVIDFIEKYRKESYCAVYAIIATSSSTNRMDTVFLKNNENVDFH